MTYNFDNFGLSEKDIEEIIEKELEKNADILIGIDDPEIIEMIDVLKKAFSKAIGMNNEELEKSIENYIEEHKSNSLQRNHW